MCRADVKGEATMKQTVEVVEQVTYRHTIEVEIADEQEAEFEDFEGRIIHKTSA